MSVLQARRALRATVRRILLRDTFTRADSALSLGNAETGQAWTAVSGTWGVSSGQLYCPSDTSSHLVTVNPGADAGNAIAEITVSGTIAVPGTDARYFALAFRVTDASNLLRVYLLAGSISLQKIVAGSGTVLASVAASTTDGTQNQIRVRYVARTIQVFLNGALMIVYQLDETEFAAFPITATTVGLRLSKSGIPATAALADNLLVTTP